MAKLVGVLLALLESNEDVLPSRRGRAAAGSRKSIATKERSMLAMASEEGGNGSAKV